jgi:mono/diheme cytochrome c family protein
MKSKILFSLFISTLILGCQRDKPNVEFIQDMMDSPAVKPQEFNPKMSGGGQANLVPPEGTVPVGFTPYKFQGRPEDAEKGLVNPISETSETLARGKLKYEVYCMVCHGGVGDGKGPVAPKFMVPVPALTSDKVKAFKDGRIFHIITEGQGVMGAYASQIKDAKDRWALVHYIRSLQKK